MRLFLLCAIAAILAGATNLRMPMPTETATKPKAKPIGMAAVACSIDSFIADYQSGCRTNETEPDWTDDFYLQNLIIFFSGANAGDKIEVVHSHLIELPVEYSINANEASAGHVILYGNKMRCDINVNAPVPGWVPIGTFTILLKDGTTGDTLCTASFTPPLNHVRPCSVCLADEGTWDDPRPSCWPDETPPDACSDALNYAPDPDHLDHTPLRYVKVMLHIFQVAPPTNPNLPYHGPQHFTSEHIDLIKSWIDGPQGVNQSRLNNLCEASPATTTPHIPDSRIRFLLEYGEEGKDIFFHPNTGHWANSLADCGSGCPGLGLKNFYVTNPNPSLPNDYKLWMADPDNRDALHIFISRGCWEDGLSSDGPDSNLMRLNSGTDCFNPFAGGYTLSGEAGCTHNPAQYVYGLYDNYLEMFDTSGLLPGADTSSIGKSLVGEFFHVMGLDHISPFQHHYNHDVGIDGCEDTDYSSGSNNLLGCNYEGRCNLTQCQLGRMHNFFETQKPGFERFLVGYDNTGKPLFSSEGNCKIVDPNIVINNGETVDWNGPRTLRSNIVVKTGGTLYIRCSIGLPENATITVETGGKLFLYGKVYNNCSQKLWQGIEVKGNAGLPQALPPVNQGFFVMQDGGTIEGARTSVLVRPGGIVLAFGGFFRNSGGGIFEPYAPYNLSRFSNCGFTCVDSVFGFSAPYYHFKLQGVRGVTFSGCDFSVTGAPANLVSAGLEGLGANFVVGSSSFTGFRYGIHAYGGLFSPFKSIIVNNCTFTDDNTGIFTLAMQNSVVTKNTFYVEQGNGNILDSPSGLMMDNSTGYVVTGNHFYKDNGSATGHYGTITEDSGPDANWIQGNYFQDLVRGNYAQGNNRGDKSGLQYWCNTDEGNVPIGFYVAGVGSGIHTNQGNGQATMNTFSHTGTDFENYPPLIFYHYKQGDNAHQPINSFGIDPIGVSSTNPCPSISGGGDVGLNKLTTTEWASIEGDFYTARTNWNYKKAELAALIDGGSTANLLGQVSGATALNAGQVSQSLLNLSPYLSNQVLSAAIAKKQVLSESAVAQVLGANPDGLREPEIHELVKTSFSSTVASAILANAANQTARTALENELGAYRATMQQKADLLLVDIAHDSLQAGLGLLRTWLAKKESIEADYAIVGTYLAVGDLDTALQKLGQIPIAHSLDAKGMAEHAHFEDLVDWWQAVQATGTPIHVLDSAIVADLKYIADHSQRRAGALAQGILNTWYGYDYRVIPVSSSGGGGMQFAAPPLGKDIVPVANYLTAYPNPAKKNLTFKWDLPDGTETAVILLSDLQGRMIGKWTANGREGRLEWSTDGLWGGIYLCRIQLPDGTSTTSKLTIIN